MEKERLRGIPWETWRRSVERVPKGERMELGTGGEVGKGQTTLAFAGNGLMCGKKNTTRIKREAYDIRT